MLLVLLAKSASWIKFSIKMTLTNSQIQSVIFELHYYGFVIDGVRISAVDGSISETHIAFLSRLKQLQQDQIGRLKNSWNSIETYVTPAPGGITVGGLRILQKSLIRLLRKTKHSVLKNLSSIKYIKKISSLAADRMSQSTSEQSATVLYMIELYEYNIKKIAYLKFLVKKYIDFISQNTQKTASGNQGPWSNLDLPMQERTFLWSDIDEETTERQSLKQNQRRYKMGLEDNAPSESKVGFYWRELRNEPYLFSNSNEDSPYPYRTELWSIP